MDILNSGSFVTLDNREKIDQLIYTARELATEVSRADGFQHSGQTNHQLGLEMWKGAEYMSRAHEEATIRNLFLSKFLERLREIERQTAVQSRPPADIPITTQSQDPMPAQVATKLAASADMGPVPVAFSPEIPLSLPQQESRDEYLGVISEPPPTESNRPSYAAECVPEWEAEIDETSNGSEAEETGATAVDESKEDELRESPPPDIPRVEEPAADVPESGAIEETPRENVTSEPTTPDLEAGVASIVLSEKEPYNFDSCTVTAVIQLLPEDSGFRKSVISVRSHDFAPQISISDISNGDVQRAINHCLETALGEYRTNLPVLAAEKLKKQKPTSKKRSVKTVDKGTQASSVSNPKTSEGSNVPPVAQSPEAAKDQQNLFAS